MSYYAIGVPGEAVRMYVEPSLPEEAALQCLEGEVAVPVAAAEPFMFVSSDGEHLFHGGVPVQGARAARQALARSHFAAMTQGGCMTPLGRVQTDLQSQGKVQAVFSGSLAALMAGQDFQIEFGMADNTDVWHDRSAGLALGFACLAWFNECKQAYKAVKLALAALGDDVEAIEGFDYTAGYPDSNVVHDMPAAPEPE